MTVLWTIAAAAFCGLLLIVAMGQSASQSRWVWGAAACCAAACITAMWSAGLLFDTWGFQVAGVASIVGALLARPAKDMALAGGDAGSHGKAAVPGAVQPLRLRGNGFQDIAGMAAVKAQILEAAEEARQQGTREQRNGIMLFGEPGNGKTILVRKLAEQLRLPLYEADIGKVNSRFVGETTERLMAVIAEARRNSPCILFLDEAESVLEAREEVGRAGGSGASDINRTTNALLTSLVDLRGSGVVVMAATNFLDRIDPAAIREGRFDWKIEVTSPDEAARLGLLQEGLANSARGIDVPDDVVRSVAARWKGFSAKRMVAVAEQAGRFARKHGLKRLGYKDLQAILREVQGMRSAPPEGTKALADLVLRPDQRGQLDSMAVRLKNAFEIEAAGGSVPTGVLLMGPPGTGKTEAARAMAKEAGYAFYSVTGGEIIGDPQRIKKVWRQAMDMRPAMIFIDESDDVLADRVGSAHKHITNQLLTMMDGAQGRVPDLLYVAATNHADAIDPAALRGGRFTEKLEITPPDAESLVPWISSWLSDRGWSSEVGLTAIAALMDGQPVANVHAILQQAVNIALVECADFKARRIEERHLRTAIRTVVG